jgi:hypothetical protein
MHCFQGGRFGEGTASTVAQTVFGQSQILPKYLKKCIQMTIRNGQLKLAEMGGIER